MFERGLRRYELAYLERVRDRIDPLNGDDAVAYARNLISRNFPVLFNQGHLAFTTGVRSQVIGLIEASPISSIPSLGSRSVTEDRD